MKEECAFLAPRMEDGILEPEHVQQIVEWVLGWLEGYELPGTTDGQLLRGGDVDVGQSSHHTNDEKHT